MPRFSRKSLQQGIEAIEQYERDKEARFGAGEMLCPVLDGFCRRQRCMWWNACRQIAEIEEVKPL